jgi:hypothetical protein
MNKDERRRENESVRAMVLRHNVAHETPGFNMFAKSAAGNRKIADMLLDLSNAVANNGALTIPERAFLAHLLKQLSRGDDVREALRIEAPKVGHRRSEAVTNSWIALEVKRRIAGGHRPGVAHDYVGRLVGKSKDAVRQICQRAKSGQ